MKVLHLMRGRKCSWHYHKQKDETFYVAEGRVWISFFPRQMWEDEIECPSDNFLDLLSQRRLMTYPKFEYGPNSFLRIPPFTLHRFEGLTNAKIIEASTYSDDSDSFRLVPAE